MRDPERTARCPGTRVGPRDIDVEVRAALGGKIGWRVPHGGNAERRVQVAGVHRKGDLMDLHRGRPERRPVVLAVGHGASEQSSLGQVIVRRARQSGLRGENGSSHVQGTVGSRGADTALRDQSVRRVFKHAAAGGGFAVGEEGLSPHICRCGHSQLVARLPGRVDHQRDDPCRQVVVAELVRECVGGSVRLRQQGRDRRSSLSDVTLKRSMEVRQ